MIITAVVTIVMVILSLNDHDRTRRTVLVSHVRHHHETQRGLGGALLIYGALPSLVKTQFLFLPTAPHPPLLITTVRRREKGPAFFLHPIGSIMLCSGLRGFQVERAGHGFHVPGAGVGWSCRFPPPPHVPSRALPAPDWRRERVRGGRLGSVVVRVKPVEDENLSPATPLQLSADRAVKESRKWGRNSSSLPGRFFILCSAGKMTLFLVYLLRYGVTLLSLCLVSAITVVL